MTSHNFKFNRSLYQCQQFSGGWKLMRVGDAVAEVVPDIKFPTMFRIGTFQGLALHVLDCPTCGLERKRADWPAAARIRGKAIRRNSRINLKLTAVILRTGIGAVPMTAITSTAVPKYVARRGHALHELWVDIRLPQSSPMAVDEVFDPLLRTRSRFGLELLMTEQRTEASKELAELVGERRGGRQKGTPNKRSLPEPLPLYVKKSTKR
jgi:hypothetical protein